MTEDMKKSICGQFCDVRLDEPMKEHTSFKIGGPADVFINAASPDEVIRAAELARTQNIPFLIMGNGSNMLVGDLGIRGMVLCIGDKMKEIRVEGTVMDIACGALMSSAAKTALSHGLSGLEFAAGIPGTVGGGVFMNAGAYGGEMKDVVAEVTYLSPEGVLCKAAGETLDFSYRHSMFSKGGYAILSCRVQLHREEPEKIREKMMELQRRRAEKQPLSMPSAGSTFKRPEGYFAGKLIQDAGLQGFCIGGAQVSEKHAGFVVNTGDATARDVLDLIRHIQKEVKARFGVALEPEVRLIGEQA